MNVSALRKSFAARPYRPLEIVLDNGAKLVVPHPEAIIISEELIALMPRGSKSVEIIAPEAVSQIRVASRNGRNGRK